MLISLNFLFLLDNLCGIWYTVNNSDGNIVRIYDDYGTTVCSYVYDDLGQLVRENNATLNCTYTWTYDNAGNVLTKKTYGYTEGNLGSALNTQTYTYGNSNWGDLLTGVNDTEIRYDAIGNPTNIIYDVLFGCRLTWEGRELTKLENTEGDSDFVMTTTTYTYNDEGIRTSKNVNGTLHEYYLDGSQIVAEKVGNKLYVYVYDENGRPIAIKYRTDSYAKDVFDYYVLETNFQGDVVAIYKLDGTKIGSYAYDAYGVVTTTVHNSSYSSIVNFNPFRYRSYYYDTDTGWYYLQSRYYNPVWGRFINADGEMSDVGGNLIGSNLFAYCFNNPVNMIDPIGNWPKWVTGALNVVSGALQMAAGAALGAAAGWTGIGAVAAGILVANGAATITQGTGQIVNDIADATVMREDNIVRTGAEDIGYAIAGETGAEIAGGAYDVAVVAANLYAGKVGLQQAGKLPIKVNINNVVNNPLDEFVTIGPADGVIQQYRRTIPQSGYGKIYATQLGNGLYQIANGHHRVAALRALGYETIKIFLTK